MSSEITVQNFILFFLVKPGLKEKDGDDCVIKIHETLELKVWAAVKTSDYHVSQHV